MIRARSGSLARSATGGKHDQDDRQPIIARHGENLCLQIPHAILLPYSPSQINSRRGRRRPRQFEQTSFLRSVWVRIVVMDAIKDSANYPEP